MAEHIELVPSALGGLYASGAKGRKTDSVYLPDFLDLNLMLAPEYRIKDNYKHRNLSVGYGAVRSDGELRNTRHRGQLIKATSHTVEALKNSCAKMEDVGSALVATELRDGFEVIDLDRCASQTYHPICDALTANGVSIVLTVESGTANSLHIYVHVPEYLDRDDFLSWVFDSSDVYVPAPLTIEGELDISRDAKVEIKSTSSIRLPGSCSFKNKSWAKPVSSISPFNNQYLTTDQATDQVRSILAALNIAESPEINRQAASVAELSIPPISDTWAAQFSSDALARYSTVEYQATSSSIVVSSDAEVLELLNLHSAVNSDTSANLLACMNTLWQVGHKSVDSIIAAIEKFQSSASLIKFRRRGKAWTLKEVTKFVSQRVAYIKAYFADKEGAMFSDVASQATAYKSHLANMKAWMMKVVNDEMGSEWNYTLTWTLAKIFQERFADSWNGIDVPVSNRDIQVWTGFGSSKSASVMKSFIEHGVLVRESEGSTEKGTSRAALYSLVESDTYWSEAYSTVSITGGRWFPLVTSLGTSLPSWHLLWHPSLMTWDGSTGQDHPLRSESGVNESPLWGMLLGQLDKVRSRVFDERKVWHGATSLIVLAMTSKNVVIPVGSPRAILSEVDIWNWIKEGVSEWTIRASYNEDDEALGSSVFSLSEPSRGP